MSESTLNIHTVLDNKIVPVPYNQSTTAEDVCILLCKQLSITTIARHLFALRITNKSIYLMPSAKFCDKQIDYDLRIRYKVANLTKLRKIDSRAYDYYFHQVRNDLLNNKVPDIISEKYRQELVGLGITDMYRVMIEKDIPRETVVSEYKKYMPKEVLKRHLFFVKSPIHCTLGKLQKSAHDARYVKAEYLKQLDIIAPEYLSETYKAIIDLNGSFSHILIKVSPYDPEYPGVKYCLESKKEKWHQICSIEELGFVSIRADSTVEISHKNGVPFYLKLESLGYMLSFISLLDGYYRLTCKWTFNICKDVPTPSLNRLYSMKCHGPVGGEFSYAKLETKRANRPGCFIIRESESRYNQYYIDVCTKDSLKPKTFKLERISNDEFIFNDDLTKYRNVQQLINAYNDPDGNIYLQECLPPSEYDISPLLLCHSEQIPGDSVTDYSALSTIVPSSPLCISCKDLQVYKDRNCLKWDKTRSRVRENDTFIEYEKFPKSKFPEFNLKKAKKFCRNPNGDIGGPWCFVENEETDEIEREYCDISFCNELDCEIFTKDHNIYTHYTNFDEKLTNLTFGVKLWDSDSILNASARLILTVLSLPINGEQLNNLGVGIEIFISNQKTGLKYGNKDKIPDYEETSNLLKSTNYTMFSLTWESPFITLFELGKAKPIFLAEYQTKNNLLGYKKNQFKFYTVHGTNVFWYFPFCEENSECDVHTTVGPIFQQFWPLRATKVGYDLHFHLRAFHSIDILLLTTPTITYPQVIISLQINNQISRIIVNLTPKTREIIKEIQLNNLLNFWEWREYSIILFANNLQFYWKKTINNNLIFELKHEIFRNLRWYSISSNIKAYWCFYCIPPKYSTPPSPLLPECALNQKEENYKGTQDISYDGRPCLPWSSKKYLSKDIRLDFNNNNESIFEAWNYCRNPKRTDTGTYCFVFKSFNEKTIEKVACHLRKCKSEECRMAGTGNDYIGNLNKTRTNRSCDYWINPKSIHKIDPNYLNETLYPDLTVKDAGNNCRNPSRNIGGEKKESSRGFTMVYRSMWKVTKGKKVEVAMKILKQEYCDSYLKEFLELAGQYAFLQSSAIIRLYGITLTSNVSLVVDYFRLGPLDQYLREHKGILKTVDLIEASSNLATALWHLKENGIVHGNIRCRKLMVNTHDENSFTVKLTDPGVNVTYASKEVHWIPVECYSNLDYAKHSTSADVWAFATTLWEIFMFGEEVKTVDHVKTMRWYASGKRLPRPTACPTDIYDLMMECWDSDPHRRKQPQAVMRDINQILYQVYNSRRTHSYAKVFPKIPTSNLENAASVSSSSLYSNKTQSTFMPYTSDDLVSANEMSDEQSTINSNQANWMNSEELLNCEDAFSCDFSNILTNFTFSTATTSLDSINSIQSIFELDDDCNVVLQGRIGQGFYGEVYKGTLEYIGDKAIEPRKVAVKKLKSSALSSGLQDFEREINIMKTLQHPNIVEILGVLREPEISLVMEFVQHGSLQSYLKIYRESLHTKQLLKYSFDIANGMDYLGKKNVVHRDLAARNILVVDENHVKISDFGLAQVMGTNDYYILKTNRELPIKWYAPESLRDGKFSVRSDVWSFGVTMCEMFNCGEEPKLPNINQEKIEGQEQQILLYALESGARFPCPPLCPQAVYIRIIYPCWEADPHRRPLFANLVVETKDLLTQY